MKIYRVYRKNATSSSCETIAYFTSLNSAVGCIKANLNPEAKWVGVKNGNWIFNISQMKKTLADGYKWGEKFGAHCFNLQGIEVIITEK